MKKAGPSLGSANTSQRGVLNSKSTASISKYFSKTNKDEDDVESPYRNILSSIKKTANDSASDENDFKTPKPIRTKAIKGKKEEKQRPTRGWPRVKQTKLTKKPGSSTIDLDVNVDHLQMAIAMSKSSYEAENPNKKLHDDPSDTTIMRMATLEEFGFKTNKRVLSVTKRKEISTAKKRKASKFRYLTPTLLTRTDEDRQSLINEKFEQIMSQNLMQMSSRCVTTTDFTITTDALKKYVAKSCRILQLNNLKFCKDLYLVDKLGLESNNTVCGHLLKDWGSIPGRDKSPVKNEHLDEESNSHINDCDGKTLVGEDGKVEDLDLDLNKSKTTPVGDDCKVDNLDLDFSMVERTPSPARKESIKMPLKKKAPSPSRSISPDLFASDEENPMEENMDSIDLTQSDCSDNEREPEKLTKESPKLDSFSFKENEPEDTILRPLNESLSTHLNKCNRSYTDVIINKFNDSVVLDNSTNEIVPTAENKKSLENDLNNKDANDSDVVKCDFSDNDCESVKISNNSPNMDGFNIKEDDLESTILCSFNESLLTHLNDKINKFDGSQLKPAKKSFHTVEKNKSPGKDFNEKDQQATQSNRTISTHFIETNDSDFEMLDCENVNHSMVVEKPTNSNVENNEMSVNWSHDTIDLTDDGENNEDIPPSENKSNNDKPKNARKDSDFYNLDFSDEEECVIDLKNDLEQSHINNLTGFDDAIEISDDDYLVETASKTTANISDNKSPLNEDKYSNYAENASLHNSKSLNITDYITQMLNQDGESLDMSQPSQDEINDEELNYSCNFAERKSQFSNNSSIEVSDGNTSNQPSQDLLNDEELNYSCNSKNSDSSTEINSNKSNQSIVNNGDAMELSQPSQDSINNEELTDSCNYQFSEETATEFCRPFNQTNVNGDLMELDQVLQEEQPKSPVPGGSTFSPKVKNCHTPSEILINKDQVTPMLNYDKMNTPALVQQLDKFGLKPLKRPRAVKMLKYIYESTHPLVDEPAEPEESASKRRKLIKPQEYSVTASEELIFERKQSSRIASCRIPLQIVWHNFLQDNPDILETVLLYEPLQLDVLHTMLKEQGFKFHKQDLVTFLDRKCITIRRSQPKK